MQLVGQRAAISMYTTFCLLSWTAVFLSSLRSGVTVMYTCSTGAQVAVKFMRHLNVGSSCQSSVQLMAKLSITHGRQHIELNSVCAVHRLRRPQRQKVAGCKHANTTRKPANIPTPPSTGKDQRTAKYACSRHEEVPQGIQKAPGITMNHLVRSSKHLRSNSQPPSYTLQPV